MRPTVAVTITSDLVCPWCWVGLRKLQQAAQKTDIDPIITWKPFQLRPNMPKEGVPKNGTPVSRVGNHMASEGNSVGINFTGLTDRTPNTTLFHATIKYLQDELKLDPSVVTQFHEAVFEAYFTLGIYPDEEGILRACKNVKDSSVYSHVKQLYNDPKKLGLLEHEIKQEAEDASRHGVSGVPTFAFGGDVNAFSGAQPVDVFARYLKQYAA